MNKKIFVAILGLLAFSLIVGTAEAKFTASVEIRDSSNNIINNKTVNINTVVSVYGHYEDTIGNAQATALMEVYYSVDNVTFTREAVLFNGTINDGEKILAGNYTMNKLGFYQFWWTCQIPGTGIRCPTRAQARTRILLVIPEPATIAGLLMAFTAFGLLALKKTRQK